MRWVGLRWVVGGAGGKRAVGGRVIADEISTVRPVVERIDRSMDECISRCSLRSPALLRLIYEEETVGCQSFLTVQYELIFIYISHAQRCLLGEAFDSIAPPFIPIILSTSPSLDDADPGHVGSK